MNLIKLLEKESKSAINWFKNNDIIVNPKKFQTKILSCDKKENNYTLNYTCYIWRHTLIYSDILLGVEIDNTLNFENHISTLWRNASKQLNAISRIWHYIGKKEKEIIINSFILTFNELPTYMAFLFFQCAALKLLSNNYSRDFQPLLEKTDTSTMETKKQRTPCSCK